MHEDCVAYFRALKGCCMGADTEELLNRAVDTIHWAESEPDGENGAAVLKLDDGKYFVIQEWQDYTGHGCRCDCWSDGPFATLEDAIRMGLDNDGRKVLGLEVPSGEGADS